MAALGPTGRTSNPEAVRVLNSFYDLKRVLEGSSYTDTGAKKKNESFFYQNWNLVFHKRFSGQK